MDIVGFFGTIKTTIVYGAEERMNTICRDIFRAIHENKWLSIE